MKLLFENWRKYLLLGAKLDAEEKELTRMFIQQLKVDTPGYVDQAIFESRIKRGPRPGAGEKHLPRRLRITRKVPGGTRSKSGLSTATNAIHKTIMKKLKKAPRSKLANRISGLLEGQTVEIKIPISDVMQTRKGTSRNLQNVFGRIPDLQEVVLIIKKGDTRHPLHLVAGRAEPPKLSLTVEINPKLWVELSPSRLWNLVDYNLRMKTRLRGLHMNTITHEMVHFLQPDSEELTKHIISLKGTDLTPEEALEVNAYLEQLQKRRPRSGYTAYSDTRAVRDAPMGSSEFGYRLDNTRVPAGAGEVHFGMSAWRPVHYTTPTEIQANFLAVHETARKSGLEFIELWTEWIDDSAVRMQKSLGVTDEQWSIIRKEIREHILKESEKISRRMFPQYLNDIRLELQEKGGAGKSGGRRYTQRSTGEMPEQPPHQRKQKEDPLVKKFMEHPDVEGRVRVSVAKKVTIGLVVGGVLWFLLEDVARASETHGPPSLKNADVYSKIFARHGLSIIDPTGLVDIVFGLYDILSAEDQRKANRIAGEAMGEMFGILPASTTATSYKWPWEKPTKASQRPHKMHPIGGPKDPRFSPGQDPPRLKVNRPLYPVNENKFVVRIRK